jgi:hypothetical protein
MTLTQSELDRWADNLREDGYPYIGSRAINHWELQADGRIRSIWRNNASEEFEYDDDDTFSTEEEIAESVYCWVHDC